MQVEKNRRIREAAEREAKKEAESIREEARARRAREWKEDFYCREEERAEEQREGTAAGGGGWTTGEIPLWDVRRVGQRAPAGRGPLAPVAGGREHAKHYHSPHPLLTPCSLPAHPTDLLTY